MMSREATQAFVEKMKTDAAFRVRVMAVEDVDARTELINAAGFDCGVAKVEALSGELADRELSGVAGGCQCHGGDTERFGFIG